MNIESNENEIRLKFDKLKKAALINLKKVIALDQRVFISYMRTTFLRGGTTDTKLRRRSGHLSRSLQAQPVETKGTQVEGRITIGTAYSRVHIGPKGQITKIQPKNKKWLTIPLEAAQTKAGVLKGSALSGIWGNTFFATSKKGNLILFGKRVLQKGPNIGQTTGNIMPLFVLKKEVKIPSRVHPEIFLPWIEKRIVADLKKEGFEVSG